MRITSAGNVGIGTTTPSTFGGGGLTLGTSSLGKNLIINSSANGSTGLLQFVDLNGNNSLQIFGGSTEMTFYGYGNRPMSFYTNDSERMRITSGGNVGIGTSSPTASSGYNTLSVNGSSGGQITLQTGNALKGYIYNTSTSLVVGADLGNSLVLDAGSSERMRITSSGNVGIGTTSPVSALDVQGTFNASDSGAALNVSGSTAYAGYQGNYDYSYAGASYSSINSNDGQSFIQSYSGTYGRSPKLGIQAFNSNTGDQDFLVAQHLIQNSYTPSDPYTPSKWIRIWDEDTGAFFFIPMYQ
jgi:hypothetical protein